MTKEQLKKMLCQPDKPLMDCVMEIYEKGKADGRKEAENEGADDRK